MYMYICIYICRDVKKKQNKIRSLFTQRKEEEEEEREASFAEEENAWLPARLHPLLHLLCYL